MTNPGKEWNEVTLPESAEGSNPSGLRFKIDQVYRPKKAVEIALQFEGLIWEQLTKEQQIELLRWAKAVLELNMDMLRIRGEMPGQKTNP